MLQETKRLDGIFSRAWYTGLAEPGKRTVKHNNKRKPLLKRILDQHYVMSVAYLRGFIQESFSSMYLLNH